jgi:DNA-binding protein WhiA
VSYNNDLKRSILEKDSLNIYAIYGFFAMKKSNTVKCFNIFLGRHLAIEIKKLGLNSVTEIKHGSINITLNDLKIPDSIKVKEYHNFLKGAFLSNGYISDPNKKHTLDICCYYKKNLDLVIKIFKYKKWKYSYSIHKDLYRVSLRMAEDVKSFILFLQSYEAFFNYEDLSIFKSLKKDSVRSTNMELANLDRQVSASIKHFEIINYLKHNNRLSFLSSKLLDFIRVREDFPDLPISDLATKLGISRSAIKSRIKSLRSLADKSAL